MCLFPQVGECEGDHLPSENLSFRECFNRPEWKAYIESLQCKISIIRTPLKDTRESTVFLPPTSTTDEVSENEIWTEFIDSLSANNTMNLALHSGIALRFFIGDIDEDLFAEWLRWPIEKLSQVLSGEIPVSKHLAERLEEQLGIDPHFWKELEGRMHHFWENLSKDEE